MEAEKRFGGSLFEEERLFGFSYSMEVDSSSRVRVSGSLSLSSPIALQLSDKLRFSGQIKLFLGNDSS